MLKISRPTILSLLASICLWPSAQTLNKEITVEHEIVPDRREALKQPLLPQVVLPPVTASTLPVVEGGVPALLQPMAPLLGPVAAPMLRPDTLHRGYAAIGYFPAYNLGMSAGYTHRAGKITAGVWTQFDGQSYKRRPSWDEEKLRLRRNTLSLGANAAVDISSAGRLHAALTYMADWYNVPAAETGLHRTASHQASDFTLDLGYRTRMDGGRFGWYANLTLGLFGNGTDGWFPGLNDDQEPLSAVKESYVRVALGLSAPTTSVSAVGLDVSLDYQRDNRLSTLTVNNGELGLNSRSEARSISLLTLRPYWRKTGAHFTVNAGALVQLTFNSGKVFHIAPDVLVSWSPAAQFTIFGRAGGGEHMNLLSALHQQTYGMAPMMAYGMSHLPLTFEGGLRVGPWRGTALKVYARHARANDWLMPVPVANGLMAYTPVDMRGWLLGAELSVDCGRVLSTSMRYEASPRRGYDKGWYLWRDRARNSLEASLTVRPISPLSVSADWRLRTGRHQQFNYSSISLEEITSMEKYSDEGRVADLSLSASWQFGQRLSAGVELNNLLGRLWSEGLIPVQGFHGLVGVTYKF